MLTNLTWYRARKGELALKFLDAVPAELKKELETALSLNNTEENTEYTDRPFLINEVYYIPTSSLLSEEAKKLLERFLPNKLFFQQQRGKTYLIKSSLEYQIKDEDVFTENFIQDGQPRNKVTVKKENSDTIYTWYRENNGTLALKIEPNIPHNIKTALSTVDHVAQSNGIYYINAADRFHGPQTANFSEQCKALLSPLLPLGIIFIESQLQLGIGWEKNLDPINKHKEHQRRIDQLIFTDPVPGRPDAFCKNLSVDISLNNNNNNDQPQEVQEEAKKLVDSTQVNTPSNMYYSNDQLPKFKELTLEDFQHHTKSNP